MGCRMKTTIEISDELSRKAREFAARRNMTFRAVVEQGLRQVLAGDEVSSFELRDASVDGRGLQDQFRDADWSKMREAAYEGHGG